MEIFEQNNLFGLRNDDGTVVLPAKFYKDFIESIKALSLQEIVKIKLVDIQYKLRPNGTYIFKDENGKQGLKKYNEENEEVVVECKYDWIYNLQPNDLTKVELNNKYGLINKKGEIVVECIYDYIYVFQPNGLAEVILNGKWGAINKQGEVIVKCKHTWHEDLYKSLDWQKGK